MHLPLTLIAGLLCFTTLSAETVSFDKQTVGKAPAGWTATLTGRGSPKWSVEKDSTAPSPINVLKQSGTASFPLCIYEKTSIRDGSVEVKFKPLSGRVDQAGGIIWRCKDAENYYVVRANALEDNVVLYKMQNGKRSSLNIVGRKRGYGVDIEVPLNEWSSLRIEFSGTRHMVFLNGKKIFEVDDSTFTHAGKVGLWTKADSVTLFDDFTYEGK